MPEYRRTRARAEGGAVLSARGQFESCIIKSMGVAGVALEVWAFRAAPHKDFRMDGSQFRPRKGAISATVPNPRAREGQVAPGVVHFDLALTAPARAAPLTNSRRPRPGEISL